MEILSLADRVLYFIGSGILAFFFNLLLFGTIQSTLPRNYKPTANFKIISWFFAGMSISFIIMSLCASVLLFFVLGRPPEPESIKYFSSAYAVAGMALTFISFSFHQEENKIARNFHFFLAVVLMGGFLFLLSHNIQ